MTSVAIQNHKSKIPNRLGGFDNLAGFEAASADANALRAAADKGANALKIWIEAAVGSIVGVAHSVTELRPLAADLTAFGHCYVPPMGILLLKQNDSVARALPRSSNEFVRQTSVCR
jgi:hypothetical protein